MSLTHAEVLKLGKVRVMLLDLIKDLEDLVVKDGNSMIKDVLFVGDTAHVRVHHSGTVVVQLLIEP
jgi:hypothetical protein